MTGWLQERDKKRIEEIRRINRETLQATGETLPEVRRPAHLVQQGGGGIIG